MVTKGTGRLQGPGITDADWWGAFELSWPRGPYRILEAPVGPWGEAWDTLPRLRVPFVERQPAAPWVFEKREVPAPPWTIFGVEPTSAPAAAETATIYRLGWPEGGIFVPDKDAPRRPFYAPIPEAAEILLDVQRAATAKNAQGLLDFVNRRGCLGVGIPGKEDFGADGVGKTGDALRELTAWIETLHALQLGTPTTRTWADVVELFESRLDGVRLSARLTRGGLVPRLPVLRLLDALYLELWSVATGGKRLRRCKRCEHFFIRGRGDQIFCTGRCARLWHVRRWKQRHRRAQQRRR